MMGMTPEPCSTTWATKISCTRFDTPRWLRTDLRISERTENRHRGKLIGVGFAAKQICPKLGAKRQSPGQGKCAVIDPKATWPKSFFAELISFLSSALRHLFTIAEPC